jgi:DNA-binding transcriptional regulator WhiA
MPTFSEQVKEELTHLTYDKSAMKAILASYITNNLVISFNDHGEI